jgi:3-keto-5-aminohexanoate cleavage enzyme
MSKKTNEKVVVIAALTGEQPVYKGGPNVPVSPEAIAEEAYNCYQAGASMIHVHARDAKTKLLTHDLTVFNDIFRRIKKKCDVTTEITGAIGGKIDPVTKKKVHFTEEQRLALLDVKPRPDAFPTPMGTMDLIGPDGRSNTFFNSSDFLKKVIPAIIARKIAWEMEIWDTSFLYNAYRLAMDGVFDKEMPVWLSYCMGESNGVQDGNAKQLLHISEEGKKLFP